MKFVFSSFLFLAVAFFATLEARACDCESDALIDGKLPTVEQKVEKAFGKSSAVFLGKVVSVKKVWNDKSRRAGVRKILVTFEVESVWKNKIGKRVTISTDSEDARCGFGFVAGKKYLVYTYGDKADFWTNNCTRTALFDKTSEDVDALDRLKEKER